MALSRAQVALYWREWTAAKAVRKARGLCITDDARHALHREALGRDCSMTELDNRDFDKVLAIFRTFSRPDDLNAQMRAEDQPEARKEACIVQCYEVLEEMQMLGKEFDRGDGKERYLNGTSWAVCKGPVKSLDDKKAAVLLGALRRSLWRMQAKARSADKLAAATNQTEGTKPF